MSAKKRPAIASQRDADTKSVLRGGFIPQIKRYFFCAVGVATFCAAAYIYSPVLYRRGEESATQLEFVLDDDLLVYQNDLIVLPFGLHGLYDIWFTTKAVDYWPISNTAFWIEWRLFGMDPLGYHAVSFALHCVETLLLWLILKRLKIPGALLAAFLFAVHPVNVESVAWIASQKNLWAMLFMQLAVLCYLKIELASGTEMSSKRFALWYGLTLACFVTAMLGKGSAVILPAILALVVYLNRPLRLTDAYKFAPFVILAGVFAYVNVFFQTHGDAEVVFRQAGFLERTVTAGASIWFYLFKAVAPVNLAPVYPMWNVSVTNWVWYVPAVAAIVVSAGLVFFQRKKKVWARPFFFAWFFFLIALSPVLGATDVGFFRYAIVADRYQHLAIIGVLGLVAAGLSVGVKRWPTFGSVGAAAVVGAAAIVFLPTAQRQANIFVTTEGWYRAAIEKNPGCWMAYNNLGNCLLNKGRMDEALSLYRKAIEIKAIYPEAHLDLGVALAQLGKTEEAAEEMRIAIRQRYDYLDAHYDYGNILYQKKEYAEAEASYRRALKIKPTHAECLNNLGMAVKAQGRSAEAIKIFRESADAKPNYADARRNLGISLAQEDRFKEAGGVFQEVLEFDPSNVEARMYLSRCLAIQNKNAEALEQAKLALSYAKQKGDPQWIVQCEDWIKQHAALTQRESNRNEVPPIEINVAP